VTSTRAEWLSSAVASLSELFTPSHPSCTFTREPFLSTFWALEVDDSLTDLLSFSTVLFHAGHASVITLLLKTLWISYKSYGGSLL
jgi:hypothetical protein